MLLREAGQKKFHSLALSVYFKHPVLKMKEYDILSRASAYLLAVDPEPENQKEGDDAFSHLKMAEIRRKKRAFQRQHGYTPASAGGKVSEMGWLEFAPREFRPTVHVVASSHVLAPYLWSDYYPHDWLTVLKQEHCRFQLDVLDGPGNSLARFALQGHPYHHPEGRDVALVHFQDEKTTLPILKDLGVQVLHMRDAQESQFEKGEDILFDGYAVIEEEEEKENEEKKSDEDDARTFFPLQEAGKLAFRKDDRFFATTEQPLPEGMCGAPAVDSDGKCCGVVEGIVPVTHENKALAGSAAFMPSYVLEAFVEYVERQMLQELLPDDMFQMCVKTKKTNTIGGGMFKVSDKGDVDETTMEESYKGMADEIKSKLSKEEYEAYMAILEDEKEKVKDLLIKRGGGNISEIMQEVRSQTLAVQQMVHDQYRKQHEKESAPPSTDADASK